MTRYLLDTNIISEMRRPEPSASLEGWLADQSDADLFISALTVGEIWRGILAQPDGRKRRRLEDWFAGPDGPRQLFGGRILAFDDPAAMVWARFMFEGARAGIPRSPFDMMIAAVAETNGCVVVTANEKHFRPAVEILNPMRF